MSGWVKRDSVFALVNEIRQHTAGAGADIDTLRQLLRDRDLLVEPQIGDAVERLLGHFDAIDDACTSAAHDENDNIARARMHDDEQCESAGCPMQPSEHAKSVCR